MLNEYHFHFIITSRLKFIVLYCIFEVESLVFGVLILTPQCWHIQCIHCQQWIWGQENVHPGTEDLRKNGHSPTVVVHLCAWMGVCAPFCKFLEGV